MIRKFVTAVFALLFAVPAFPHTTQFSTGKPHSALHLMNDSEFAAYLDLLDANMLRAQGQLERMDFKSLRFAPQDREDLKKSYDRCLQSLDNAREEIQKLSQKQTLKMDLFLLIDLNELARNLDALDQGLMNPAAVAGSNSSVRKSLEYARSVLGIDVTLASDISTFQHHFLALTGVIDATLDQTDNSASDSQTQQ